MQDGTVIQRIAEQKELTTQELHFSKERIQQLIDEQKKHPGVPPKYTPEEEYESLSEKYHFTR